MVSAGELGTDSRFLEHELQKILDICHTWGAILLLDEADVFLEKRNMQDIHRNALVSIFLRQLEYFQGILFLTTNRVEVSWVLIWLSIFRKDRLLTIDHRRSMKRFNLVFTLRFDTISWTHVQREPFSKCLLTALRSMVT